MYKTKIHPNIFRHTLVFFISNQGQASALKVAYVFKVFGAQSCLMVEQVTYVYKKYNNFQDSKSIFMISNFKNFPIILLRQLNLGVILVWQLFYIYYKGKTPLLINLQFALLLSEREFSPESSQQCAIRGLVAYEPVADKKN